MKHQLIAFSMTLFLAFTAQAKSPYTKKYTCGDKYELDITYGETWKDDIRVSYRDLESRQNSNTATFIHHIEAAKTHHEYMRNQKNSNLVNFVQIHKKARFTEVTFGNVECSEVTICN